MTSSPPIGDITIYSYSSTNNNSSKLRTKHLYVGRTIGVREEARVLKLKQLKESGCHFPRVTHSPPRKRH